MCVHAFMPYSQDYKCPYLFSDLYLTWVLIKINGYLNLCGVLITKVIVFAVNSIFVRI